MYYSLFIIVDLPRGFELDEENLTIKKPESMSDQFRRQYEGARVAEFSLDGKEYKELKRDNVKELNDALQTRSCSVRLGKIL